MTGSHTPDAPRAAADPCRHSARTHSGQRRYMRRFRLRWPDLHVTVPVVLLLAVAAPVWVSSAGAAVGDAYIPGVPEPPTYVVQRTTEPIAVDGRLDDPAWQLAPRTESWRWLDTNEPARHRTYGQMAWDDQYLYFAFYSEDPDIWSTMQVRDEPVFVEEDFEIFLDPDGDEFHYYEWQINPLGTLYDVVWQRPANTPGPANRGDRDFDLHPMPTGFHVDGTVWERHDTDSGWTAEVGLSWEGLGCIPGRFRTPPAPGDTWRIGFSRVEVPQAPRWQSDWTWPIHGEYNMHIGQRDAYVQFSAVPLSARRADFTPVPRLYVAEVRLDPESGDGGVVPGRLVSLVPRIANRGALARQVEVRLSSPDSLIAVLDSVAVVDRVDQDEERWAEDGFTVRLSRSAAPGRNLLFQVAMRDQDGRWSGDYFLGWAEGRDWETVFQLHEGVQELLVDEESIWGISRANVWHWSAEGEVLGFYQADDGLPRHVRSLARDGRGRIWAAGQRGIAYFQAGNWHELTGEQGLPSRGFACMQADRDGGMWIATSAGLYRYTDRVEAAWTTADGYAPGRVGDLLVDAGGAVWVIGQGRVHRFDAGDRTVLGARHGLPSDSLTAVAAGSGGDVWVAGVPTGRNYRDGGVGRYDGTSWEVWRRCDGLARNEVTALFGDRHGRIWAGHPDGALSVFDGRTWDRWAAVPAAGCTTPAPRVGAFGQGPGSFVHDDEDRVWLLGREGLTRYDGREWRTWTWRNGLMGGRVSAVVQGPDGRVYIGDGRTLSVFRR